jgi:hypothetical protein
MARRKEGDTGEARITISAETYRLGSVLGARQGISATSYLRLLLAYELRKRLREAEREDGKGGRK